eukprot:4552494-Pyramimonas_sp.AAC.2
MCTRGEAGVHTWRRGAADVHKRGIIRGAADVHTQGIRGATGVRTRKTYAGQPMCTSSGAAGVHTWGSRCAPTLII